MPQTKNPSKAGLDTFILNISNDMKKFDRIFTAELVQDIPLWLGLLMGIYPELQNEYILYGSFVLGSIASIYIIKAIKDGEYSPGIIAENPSDAFSFSIYSIVLLVVLLIASYKEMLYMSNLIWGYLIVFSVLELIFFLKKKQDIV